MAIDLDKLEKLAREATPGPWSTAKYFPSHIVLAAHANRSLGGSIYPDEQAAKYATQIAHAKDDCYPGFESSRIGKEQGERNGQFIAAANPAVVLELIGELREAREALREVLYAIEHANDSEEWRTNVMGTARARAIQALAGGKDGSALRELVEGK